MCNRYLQGLSLFSMKSDGIVFSDRGILLGFSMWIIWTLIHCCSYLPCSLLEAYIIILKKLSLRIKCKNEIAENEAGQSFVLLILDML